MPRMIDADKLLEEIEKYAEPLGVYGSSFLQTMQTIIPSLYKLGEIDDEDSPKYEVSTLNRAITFLNRCRDLFSKTSGIGLPLPEILPGAKRSIDLHWKDKKFELLMTIPENPEEQASFYGDNYKDSKLKGALKIEDRHSIAGIRLLVWIKERLSSDSNDSEEKETCQWNADDCMERLDKIYKECSVDDWDSYEGKAISEKTLEKAKEFVKLMSVSVSKPDSIFPEPDGMIEFEWYISNENSLSVSIDSDGRLYYAAQISGNEPFGISKRLSSLIQVIDLGRKIEEANDDPVEKIRKFVEKEINYYEWMINQKCWNERYPGEYLQRTLKEIIEFIKEVKP